MKILYSFAGLAMVAGLGLAPPVEAQVPPNCEVASATDPDRQVLSCAFGMTIELEAAAEMGFGPVTAGAAPQVIELTEGAAFIEVTPGTDRPQIRTPHAIAAVRGTVYVVDVTPEVTSVFVVHGEVAVSDRDDAQDPVVLGAGDGVDVGPGGALDVQRWGAARVAAVLARFGR